MTADKPSRNEDEYFAREEAERLTRLRAQEASERVARARKSHHMKCPKCGVDLGTEAFHGIDVDRCPECHGVWFDHGEFESLMKDDDAGVLGRVMGDLWASVQKLRAGG
jgi:hypothetical protein